MPRPQGNYPLGMPYLSTSALIWYLCICLSVGPVSESHRLLIRGWWSSLPIALAIWTLDSVPIFKFLCFPSCDGSGTPLSPPPRFSRVLCPPGHLSRLLSPFFLFASSPSISVHSAAPLQQRLDLHRPSVGSLQPSGWRTTKFLSWFPVQRPICKFSPPPDLCGWWYLAWVWAEGWRRRSPPRCYGVPRRVVRRRPGYRAVFDARVISSILAVPVSLSAPPPPPSPFPRTTLLVPILSLLTEEYFRDLSVRPCPSGPVRPSGCSNVSGPRPCPPPPSLFHGHLFWVA